MNWIHIWLFFLSIISLSSQYFADFAHSGTQNTAVGLSTEGVRYVHINLVTCLKDKLDKLVLSASQVLDTYNKYFSL